MSLLTRLFERYERPMIEECHEQNYDSIEQDFYEDREILHRLIRSPKIKFENDPIAAIFSHPCLLSGQLIHMLMLGLY